MVGTVGATGMCGPVGPAITSPFIAVPSGSLSTYDALEYFKPGQEYADPQGAIGAMFIGSAKALNVEELDCPTFGLGTSTAKDGKVLTTVGPPWLSIVIPPVEMLSLNPQWDSLCPGVLA